METKYTYTYRVSLTKEKSVAYDADTEVFEAGPAATTAISTINAHGQIDRENLVVILLNAKNVIIGANHAHMGTLNKGIVGVQEIIRPALIMPAYGMI